MGGKKHDYAKSIPSAALWGGGCEGSVAEIGRGWCFAQVLGQLCHTLQAGGFDCWARLSPWWNGKWTSVTTSTWHLFVVQLGFLPCLWTGRCRHFLLFWSVSPVFPMGNKNANDLIKKRGRVVKEQGITFTLGWLVQPCSGDLPHERKEVT